MANYRLTNGYKVSTTSVGEKTEFMTTNPEGRVISTVYLGGADALELERDLMIGDRLAAL
jgi:hypothetical protein